ncbi:hypothetical protein BZL53_14525 [Flavobacterium columnare]|uniref:hypothetical protein n=1 Tax=Flavobacterium columnare TaxID=996 RepID=UPI000981FFE3|nr:hypothetical protein [Flavobacterium columnare]OOB81618.1 hypothetical protein BZL53_14525 [Flavobacterium columnare]
MEINFDFISITGRYIYGYLCLNASIVKNNETALPEDLNSLIKGFVETDSLDVWHENIEEIIPSFILNNSYDTGYYEIISEDLYILLKEYYSNISKVTIDIIENLFTLGFSNLYGAFESNISLKYLHKIMEIMEMNNIPLPNYEIVKSCSVTERKGWGELVKMDDFLKAHSDALGWSERFLDDEI